MTTREKAAPDLWSRDAGEASALDALSTDAMQALHNAMRAFVHVPFTSDMVWDRLSYAVREQLGIHPNALGAIFTWHAKEGRIERTGATVASQRKSAHGRRIAVWRWK